MDWRLINHRLVDEQRRIIIIDPNMYADGSKCINECHLPESYILLLIIGKFTFCLIVITHIHNKWNKLWMSLCLYFYECYHSLFTLFQEGVGDFSAKGEKEAEKGWKFKEWRVQVSKKGQAGKSWDSIMLIVSIICCLIYYLLKRYYYDCPYMVH